MRTAHLTYFILFVLMVQPVLTNAQPVKVKSNNKSDTSVANKTAAKVFFVYQKSTARRDSIVNPPEGMIIYNTTAAKIQRFSSKAWKQLNINEHYIGEEFGGGIVLYLDSTGQHGIVMTPVDQAASAQWGFFENQVGAHAKKIGEGKRNTDIISKNSKEDAIAANVCNNLKLNEYTDWFLPSIEELKLMYYNFKAKALGNFSSTAYWSSSETDFNNAWIMDFGLGVDTENNVIKYHAVRAVRYF